MIPALQLHPSACAHPSVPSVRMEPELKRQFRAAAQTDFVPSPIVPVESWQSQASVEPQVVSKILMVPALQRQLIALPQAVWGKSPGGSGQDDWSQAASTAQLKGVPAPTGEAVGLVVGDKVGLVVGLVVGEVVGLDVGLVVGLDVGLVVGLVVGESVVVGDFVGEVVGLDVGEVVGDVVGLVVGEVVGLVVGLVVGEVVGLDVGLVVGDVVGLGVLSVGVPPESEGLFVGLVVGEVVGESVKEPGSLLGRLEGVKEGGEEGGGVGATTGYRGMPLLGTLLCTTGDLGILGLGLLL
mmetsp:Transcript_19951/g.41671  ORF Transcript_19951/g.41671 Transcript_19951/m.41671 type:complete len:296 (+) Transcript_19951:2396-3283(+)